MDCWRQFGREKHCFESICVVRLSLVTLLVMPGAETSVLGMDFSYDPTADFGFFEKIPDMAFGVVDKPTALSSSQSNIPSWPMLLAILRVFLCLMIKAIFCDAMARKLRVSHRHFTARVGLSWQGSAHRTSTGDCSTL